MAEIQIYGIVGEDVSANYIKSQLATLASNEPLIVRINSEGGSVADGFTIYDSLSRHAGRKTAIIKSMALSAASHIAMACDEIEITENGYMMIHNPHMPVDGDDAEHASAAELLSKLKLSMVTAYARKSRKSPQEVLAIMQRTTWLNAEEALAAGFVSRILPGTRSLPLPRAYSLRHRPAAKATRSARRDWDTMISHVMAEGKTKTQAIRYVVTQFPELHAKYLKEHNKRS